MATFMKVLEIERIILDLVERICGVLVGANFKLDNNNYVLSNKNRICALSHPRYEEL